MLSFKSEDQKQNISIKDAKKLLESLKLVEQKRIEISRKHSGSEAKLKELDDVEEKINNLGKKTGYTNNNGRDTQLYYNDYQKLRQEEEAKIEEKQEYVNQCCKTTIKQYNLSSKKYEEQPIPTVSIQGNIDFLQKVILLREQFSKDEEFNNAIHLKLDGRSDLDEDGINHWIWQINNHKWNYEENNDYYYIKKDGQREEIGGKITVFVYENKNKYPNGEENDLVCHYWHPGTDNEPKPKEILGARLIKTLKYDQFNSKYRDAISNFDFKYKSELLGYSVKYKNDDYKYIIKESKKMSEKLDKKSKHQQNNTKPKSVL